MTPQLILTLSPKGELLAELPSTTNSTYCLKIADGAHGRDQLYRMLIAQRENGLSTIGTQSSPTQSMIDNLDDARWQAHIKHLAPRSAVLKQAEAKRLAEASENLDLEDIGL